MANRNIRCVDCLQTKWLSQQAWRKLLETYNTPRSLKRNFRCVKCKKLEKEDPLAYQMFFGRRSKKLRTKIRSAYKEFKKDHDVVKLQNLILGYVADFGLDNTHVLFHQSSDGKKLYGITINNVSFLGSITIPLYSERKKSY